VSTGDRDICAGQLWKRHRAANFVLVRVLDVDARGVTFRDVLGGDPEILDPQLFRESHAYLPASSEGLVIAGTGHRPEKLARSGDVREVRSRVYRHLARFLASLRPTCVISGMAPGFDQWLAWASIEANVPWYAAVPHAGQESEWPETAQREYHELLARSPAPPFVLASAYRPRSASDLGTFELRNRWMVDRASIVLACYLGYRGGTQNAVVYATAQKRPLLFINKPNLLPS
jgi:uncharacterized phage-like protein YoqJ